MRLLRYPAWTITRSRARLNARPGLAPRPNAIICCPPSLRSNSITSITTAFIDFNLNTSCRPPQAGALHACLHRSSLLPALPAPLGGIILQTLLLHRHPLRFEGHPLCSQRASHRRPFHHRIEAVKARLSGQSPLVPLVHSIRTLSEVRYCSVCIGGERRRECVAVSLTGFHRLFTIAIRIFISTQGWANSSVIGCARVQRECPAFEVCCF